MKKQLLTIVILLITTLQGLAQTPQYFVNTGNSGNSIPFGGGGWSDQRAQLLYIPGEFGIVPVGFITKVYFRSAGTYPASTYTNLSIDLIQNSSVSLPGTSWVTGGTNVLTQATFSVPASTNGQWIEYPLQTPFFFDPTLSLTVDTRQTATAGGYAIPTLNVTGTRRQYAASAAATPGGSGTQRYDFGFDLIQGFPCTGLPTSNISGPKEVCPNKQFTLSFTSFYTGVTRQWQTSPDGTTWTNWAGAVNPNIGSITDVLTTMGKYYRCILTCVATGQSFTTPVHYVNIAPFYYCYCDASKATAGPGADVGNVNVKAYPAGTTLLNNGPTTPLTNNTTATKQSTDFRYTVPPIPMYRDSAYTINLTQINSAAYTTARAAVYIDYNRNGRFDTSERVLLAQTTNSIPTPNIVRDTFQVSTDTNKVKIGLTGMRVILRNGTIDPDTCATYPDGETEDYLVDLRYVPCSGLPDAGVITGDTSMCIGYEYTLTDSTYTKQRFGILNSWDISADAVNWTPLANTSNKDSITRLFYGQPLYYRLKSICTITGDTATSAPHRVNLKPTYKCYCFSQAIGKQQDTSDIGAFTVDKFDVNTGGSHLMNPLARYKRTDYTDVTPTHMVVDSSYNMYVYHTMPGKYHADAKVTIFMDFDNDGVYEQPYERVYTGFTNVNTHTLVQNVVIPASVVTNTPTGMRIILNNNLAPNAPSDEGCGTYRSGETEDYMVTFIKPFPAGIAEASALSDVQLFPNPTQGRFSISFSSNAATDVAVRVITLTGQQVASESYKHAGGRFTQQLDMTGKAQGVYFVEVEANGHKTKHKLIVQ